MSATAILTPSQSASCVDLHCPNCDSRKLTAKYWPRVFAGRITDRWRMFCGACRWSRFFDHDPNGPEGAR